jgi:hypothetical protein
VERLNIWLLVVEAVVVLARGAVVAVALADTEAQCLENCLVAVPPLNQH